MRPTRFLVELFGFVDMLLVNKGYLGVIHDFLTQEMADPIVDRIAYNRRNNKEKHHEPNIKRPERCYCPCSKQQRISRQKRCYHKSRFGKYDDKQNGIGKYPVLMHEVGQMRIQMQDNVYKSLKNIHRTQSYHHIHVRPKRKTASPMKRMTGYNMRMGTLYLVATPIGNLEDISFRAVRTLSSVDRIACEDTRRAGLLLSELAKRSVPGATQKHPDLVRYDNHTEMQVVPELIALLTDGKDIALISDAGTPLLSDPGYVLVSEARKRDIPVVAIPGASALLTALTASGLPADRFTFIGYPPEKQSHRRTLFADMRSSSHTLQVTYVLYAAPHKLTDILADMKEEFGDCSIIICRELTKVHEEYWRGTVSEAQEYFITPKGEFVLLLRTK